MHRAEANEVQSPHINPDPSNTEFTVDGAPLLATLGNTLPEFTSTDAGLTAADVEPHESVIIKMTTKEILQYLAFFKERGYQHFNKDLKAMEPRERQQIIFALAAMARYLNNRIEETSSFN